MYGNILTNAQIAKLHEASIICIDPYTRDNFKESAYTLNPLGIERLGSDGKWGGIIELNDNNKTITLDPGEYVKVVVKQRIVIRQRGLVGNFIISSNSVESGLLVLCGQIDATYGEDGNAVKFGLKNLLNTKNSIDRQTRLAHMQVIDYRGTDFDPVKLSAKEKRVWKDRIIDWNIFTDDGPNYGTATE
jgi:dUTPase